ncbi:MAG: hypothetical protein ACRC14_14530 [Paracoccaceae bacterium]
MGPPSGPDLSIFDDTYRTVAGMAGAGASRVVSVKSLFDRYDQLVPRNLLAGYAVLALGLDDMDARDASRWTGDLGGLLLRASAERDMYHWLSRNTSRKAILLVNCDFVGDAETNCDLGIGLRHFWPDLVVIFASSRVRSNDLSKERLAICDATLRMPFAQSAFKLCVGVAIENHTIWKAQAKPLDGQANCR